jgi:hypothetical protein
MTDFRDTANKIIMTLTGIVLLLASVFKIHQLITTPVVSDGFWESWLFFVIQIPLVTGLGLWLVSGLFRKAGWLVGVFALLVFLADTVYKMVTGAESCGCFGSVEVDPLVTLLAFNVPFLLLMLIFPPRNCKLLPPPWPNPQHFLAVAIPTAILLPSIVMLLVISKVEPVRPDDQGWQTLNPAQTNNNNTNQQNTNNNDPNQTEENDIKDNGQTDNDVSNEDPKNAQGQNDNQNENETTKQPHDQNDQQIQQADPLANIPKWPLLEYIDIAEKIDSGPAIVIMYHYNCPTCRDAIPVYDEKINQYALEEVSFAYIEAPPYGPDNGDSPIPEKTTVPTGKLQQRENGKEKWHIGTPFIALLYEGRLVKYYELVAPEFEVLLQELFNADLQNTPAQPTD